jgi:hypothetical protein
MGSSTHTGYSERLTQFSCITPLNDAYIHTYIHTYILGISDLHLVIEENILVSLSYDATCKLLDPHSGQVLFSVNNHRRCMYTGISSHC